MDETLVVNEIFLSLQGESTRAGMPCVFVRLMACDLRCAYCDSQAAFYEGTKWAVPRIVAEVEKYHVDMVEITGGEPLLQSGVHDLMRTLADRGKLVLLETSGAHDISGCDPRVIRIVDVKCPSSGEMKRNRSENLEILRMTDEVKFVIGDRADFDWAVETVRKLRLTRKCPVLFSAWWNKLPLAELAGWIRDSGEPVRLQPQLHKILWGVTPGT